MRAIIARNIFAAVLGAVVLWPHPVYALSEYDIKAQYIFHFFRFVSWPEKTESTLCTLGRDPFAGELEQLNERLPASAKIKITRYIAMNAAVMKNCKVLFVSSEYEDRMQTVANLLAGQPVLTVSDSEDFYRSGGMIELAYDGKSVGLKIDVDQAKAHNLTIRSDLIKLARTITFNGKTQTP